MIPSRDRLASSFALVTALIAALAAAVSVMLLISPLAATEPTWLSEAVVSLLTAAAWMLAGLSLAPRHRAAGVMLFLPGAACAWFLSRGIVHSISPYYGLLSLAAACAGAAFVWSARRRTVEGRHAGVIAVMVPLLTLLLGATAVLAAPTLGITRQLWANEADAEAVRVHIIHAERDGIHVVYLWARNDGPVTAASRGDRAVNLELDPGSGPGSYHLARVRHPAEIERVCGDARTSTRDHIEAEIARGSIPRFITRLPFNLAACERGAIWEARP